MNSIPVLATFKYFFNSGWLAGAEGGVDFQDWDVKISNSHSSNNTLNHTSNWSFAPMLGGFGGYQWSNGIALTSNISYVFGKRTDHLTSDDTNKALAFYTLGPNLSYKLPAE